MPDKASWPLSRQPLSSRWPACDGDLMKSLQREETRTRTIQFSSFQWLSRVWLFATHGLQHARLPCLSPTPGVYSNSFPLSQWCHPTTISSSIIPFSSDLQSGSFQMSQFFTSGDQSIGSFSFNISPSNEYWGLIFFRMNWLDPFAVQGTLKRLLQHHSSKASTLQHSALFIVQVSHPYMTTRKTIVLTRWTLAGKEMSLLFNTLSRLIITFLPRSKRLWILWLQSASAVILEPPKKESLSLFPSFPHLFAMKWWDQMPWS